MPKLKEHGKLTFDDLTAAIRRLSPTELGRFTRWLAEWKDADGEPMLDEAVLIQITKASLRPADERRLKRLTSKSERGTLTSEELQEYQALGREAEQLDSRRTAALAELVRRRGTTVRAVLEEFGCEGELRGT